MDEDVGETTASSAPSSLSDAQLAAFEEGWAAAIMPVAKGWKVSYFSMASFEKEPGTTFPSVEAAIDALRTLLVTVNLPDERDRARRELQHRGNSS